MSETQELIDGLKAVSTGRDTFNAAIMAKSAVMSAMKFLCRADGRFSNDDLSYVELMSVPPVASFIGKSDLRPAFDFVGTLGSHAVQGRRVSKNQAKMSVEYAIGILSSVRCLIEPGAPAYVFSSTMNERETRKEYIDLFLSEAGWELVGYDNTPAPGKAGTEIKVTGMPPSGQDGYCDYVLFGMDGKPIAVVEAKKTAIDPDKGRVQVKLYGERLVAEYGCEMPILYYTNGYQIWCIDGVYPDRQLHAFHTEDEIGVLLHLRQRAPMPAIKINEDIAGRPYQITAVTRLCEWFNKKHRRGLLVMATGTGKTRVSASLIEALTRYNWVKTILFLADRTELVRQAHREISKILPEMTCAVISDKKDTGDPKSARLVFSTHQTMIRAIDREDKKFGSGRFNLIIIDEAHRSIFNKYGAIFEYFDSLLVGLTATPRDEVDANTYRLFECGVGEPNFAYSIQEGKDDGWLVGWYVRNYSSDIMREGIRYADLTQTERDDYESGFDDAGYETRPEMVSPSEIFNAVYNEPTCDLMLEKLMTEGQMVESGELIGKSIVFAVNHKHAQMIVERFHKLYPHLGADYCQLIDNKVDKAPQLIDDFKNKREFRVAVSVDMLDTGVDVREILNLVFFKKVRSKIKFFQMIGRGTRLCPDVFGTGKDKDHFLCFDFCGNFEYFGAKEGDDSGGVSLSVSQRIFEMRVKIMHALQDVANQSVPWRAEYWKELRNILLDQVTYLRGRRSLISVRKAMPQLDKLRNPDDWRLLDAERIKLITRYVTPVVCDTAGEHEQIKLFDYNMLAIEHSLVVTGNVGSAANEVGKIRRVAKSLLKLGTIDEVMSQKDSLELVAGSVFWKSCTIEQVEPLRKQLRELMKYITRDSVDAVILHIEDSLTVEPTPFGKLDIRTYREKVVDYLAEHIMAPVVDKIRKLEPITKNDMRQLELLLWKTLGTKEQYEHEKYRGSLAGFVRSLIDIDDKAIQEKFGHYLAANALNSDQQEFLKTLIDYLRENGEVTAEDLVNEEPLCNYSLTSLFENRMGELQGILGTFRTLVPEDESTRQSGYWGGASEEDDYAMAAEGERAYRS